MVKFTGFFKKNLFIKIHKLQNCKIKTLTKNKI